jgi:hypothetical protein
MVVEVVHRMHQQHPGLEHLTLVPGVAQAVVVIIKVVVD